MNLYWTGLVIIPSSPNKKSKKTQVFRCHQNNISYSLVQGVMLRNRINMSMIDLDRFSCIGVSTGYLGLFESQNRIYNQPSPKSAVNHSFQKNKNGKHFPIPQVFPQPKHTQTKNTHTHTPPRKLITPRARPNAHLDGAQHQCSTCKAENWSCAGHPFYRLVFFNVGGFPWTLMDSKAAGPDNGRVSGRTYLYDAGVGVYRSST